MKYVYVYGWKHKINSMKYLGYKSPDGKDILNYISSSQSEEFIRDHALGLLTRVTLFAAPAIDENINRAKTLEWWGLDYAKVHNNDMFYNKRNNAHKVDESLMTADQKAVIADFCDDKGMGIDTRTEIEFSAEQTSKYVEELARKILNGDYDTQLVKIKTADIFDESKTDISQVRAMQNAGRTAIEKIKSRMRSEPELARETFLPPIFSVNNEGKPKIIDGISRSTAAMETPGWEEIPALFFDENIFGSTEKERFQTYQVFGSFMNRESFEVKTENSDDDIKAQWMRIIEDDQYNLDLPLHADEARRKLFALYKNIVPTQSKLAGLWKSLMRDHEKKTIDSKYNGKHLIVYTDDFLTKYEFKHYGRKNIATVREQVSRYKEVVGYICRRMKNVKANKGAIILYYGNNYEYDKNKLVYSDAHKKQINPLTQDVIDTIEYMGLSDKITVEVLPAFDEKQ